MKSKKGFSLAEIIVVLVIVGIAAAVTIPSVINSVELSKAQSMTNNLLAIVTAQQKFYEDNSPSIFCVQTVPGAGCGGTTASLFSNLRLNSADNFTYTCFTTGETIPYNCRATDTVDTITIDPNVQPSTACVGPSGQCPAPP